MNFLYTSEQLLVKLYLYLPKNTLLFSSVWKNNFNVRWAFYVKYVNSTEEHEHFMVCNKWISHHLSALSTYFWNLERHIFLTFHEKINMRLWATCLNHRSVFTVVEMVAPCDARVYLWRCGRSSWVIESLALLFLLHDMFWLVSGEFFGSGHRWSSCF
jgi:hypothetical protein